MEVHKRSRGYMYVCMYVPLHSGGLCVEEVLRQLVDIEAYTTIEVVTTYIACFLFFFFVVDKWL